MRPPGSQAIDSWYDVSDVDTIPSPALLIYRQRLEDNVSRMLAICGGPKNLRPHIKTHKMREVIELQLARGITKFKCATIAEAEMAAEAGARDLLLAYQPVGPAAQRVARLVESFSDTRFSVLGDDPRAMQDLSRAFGCLGAKGRDLGIEVLLDINIGQNRTGLPAGAQAFELYRSIQSLPGLRPGGLHAYDGHITDSDPVSRAKACDLAFEPVLKLRNELIRGGLAVPRVVAGGTPTFPIHAQRSDVECSPGTCVFWDAGYATKLPDLGFEIAALLLTRVVSKPSSNRLCLDLGHKAVASEMPQPRAQLIGLEDAKAVVHSEEHLVVETASGAKYEVGDHLFAIPWHICPTVALHAEAVVIENGASARSWKVAARDRRLTI